MDLVLFNTELSPFIFSLFARLTRSFLSAITVGKETFFDRLYGYNTTLLEILRNYSLYQLSFFKKV